MQSTLLQFPMKSSLKSLGIILGCCALLSLILAFFNGRSLAALIDLGSYVGAGVMLMGGWRSMATPTPVIEHLHMQQRVENYHAEVAGQAVPHRDMVQMFLSSGPLFFGGVIWLVALQAVRYGFDISLG